MRVHEDKVQIRDRYGNFGPAYRYRLSIHELQTDFQIESSVETITVAAEKATELELSVQRANGAQGAVGSVEIRVEGLPDSVTCKPVVSEVEGDTASKIKLMFTCDGTEFSGPIRIVGVTESPKTIERACITPSRFGARSTALWLTSTGKP